MSVKIITTLNSTTAQDETKTIVLTKKKEGTGYTPKVTAARRKRVTLSRSKKSHPIQYDSDDDFV